VSLWLWGTAVCPAGAELAPHQVVIVANSNSPESLMVARHYATRRGIPLKHIAKLDLSKDEAMTREEYEQQLVFPLRRMLETQGIQRSVRVLVTVYGVPLRVGAPVLTTEERRWRWDAGDRLTQARSRLLSVERLAQQVAGPPKSPEPSNDKRTQGLPEFDRQVAFLYGAYGVYALAALELKRLSTEFADASVDSELSLLWSDGGDYGATWRVPNRFHHAVARPATARREIPLLMVSRLDAPTADRALKLVDQAIETETQGLAGTIYLDARGLPKDQMDTYGRYDQSLRDLKDFLDGQAPYRSVLENTEARFR